MGTVVLVLVFLAIASCWMVVRDTGMEKALEGEKCEENN